MNTDALRVPMESLTAASLIDDLPFETTDDLQPLEGTIGQERAINALEFGLSIRTPGFNVYVAGQPGTGRNTTLASYVRRIAENLPPPQDWCYVHNFDDPSRPLALRLPAGMGARLAADLSGLIEGCLRALPRVFEGPEYQERVQEVMEEINARRAETTASMEEEARREGVAVQFTAMGITTTPLEADGRPLTREAYEALPEAERVRIRDARERVQAFVQGKVIELQKLDREADQRKDQVDREVASFAVKPAFDELQEEFAEHPYVVDHLERVEKDMAAHIHELIAPVDPQAPAQAREAQREGRASRYAVNVIIDNQGARGAPVVFEFSPTYYNLFGRVEYRTSMGGAQTDLTMIRPGAAHRANGGFLICQARDLLSSPVSWEAMKRTLRSREARIENLGEQATPVPFSSLNPQPIPFNAKIIIVGVPSTHRLLQVFDDDFRKLFKVKADFDISMENTPQNILKYASFVVNRIREEGLRPFDKGAIARLVEFSCRLVEDQRKLTTRFVDVAEMVTEADYWAAQDGSPLVHDAHVERAAQARVARSNLPAERLRELIEDGTIRIQTEGAAVGQVNGLAVIDLGDYVFGSPSRITARTSLGRGDVANIEYEAQMAGRVHNKGFMILTGYLMGKFGRDKPMAVRASIGFEQMYSDVDGDSASSTELYCLLSSLAEIPIKQAFAVTGSVNQHGQVQAVGGVTHKVEGFYDVCRLKGLTGEQGVIIPRDNINNLVLRRDVAEAIREGRFHLYAAGSIEEGIELLTGVPAGEPQEDGGYPAGTLFGAVDATLRAMAERARQQAPGSAGGDDRRPAGQPAGAPSPERDPGVSGGPPLPRRRARPPRARP